MILKLLFQCLLSLKKDKKIRKRKRFQIQVLEHKCRSKDLKQNRYLLKLKILICMKECLTIKKKELKKEGKIV